MNKFLSPEPIHADEAGYTIEDGIVKDATEGVRPNTRMFGEFTRWHQPTREEILAEEAAWAARSGPVIIKRKGRTAA